MNIHLPTKAIRRNTLLIIAGCFLFFTANAQAPIPPPTGTTTTAATTTTTPAATDDTKQKVTIDSLKKALAAKKTAEQKIVTLKVTKFFTSADACGKQDTSTCKCVYPEDYIIVYTNAAGVEYAQKRPDSLRLWINGVCFTNIKPLFVNKTNSSIVFRLNTDTTRTSPWKMFYAWPNYWTKSRIAIFSLGTFYDEFRSPDCEISSLKLHTSSWWMMWLIAYPLIVIILILLWRYGKGMGKDSGLYAQNGVKIVFDNTKTNAASGTINIKDIPYSLARFQFLFWLLIIFFSIIHIWAVTDDLAAPTGTVLILLGISGSTFYLGKLIDSKPENEEDTDPNKTPEQLAAESKQKSTALVQEFIDKKSKSKGWPYDLLNDGKTISLHRLQLLLFTIFLGIYFIWQVLYCLKLPQFSETMMTLMGISSGLYAGLKTKE
ncbi:MAG: hypothetical protein K0S33_2733 [Bacteroidetes bacterium]|jgi:hypothetical protein|nr:hypothetical protein [Bacteroidota bacterium]